MSSQREHWNRLSSLPPDASVIDRKDTRGDKNRYIAGLRNSALLEVLRARGVERPILDFGCGTGGTSTALVAAGRRVIGVDISEGLLRRTGERILDGSALFVRFDGKALPIADGCLDAAVTYVVLNHIMDDRHLLVVLGEIRRCLCEGGLLVAIEQVSRQPRISETDWQHHRTITGFLRLFESAGFSADAVDILRYSRFPTTYAVRYGVLGDAVFPLLRCIERATGRIFGVLPWGYHDVRFVLRKS